VALIWNRKSILSENKKMLLSKIKIIFSNLAFFGGKNKGRNGYLKNVMDMHVLPANNSHQSGRYKQRKNRLAHFRQVLKGKKRPHREGYNGTSRKKLSIFKLTGLAAVSLSFLLLILVGGGQAILNNFSTLPFFKISEVIFSDTSTVSKEKLREASGIILHQTSLVGLNCAQVEASLNTVPWVAQAVVKRKWPSTVNISIVENVPVALLHSKKSNGAQLQYIDRKGVPFLQVGPGSDIDFPVITGLNEINEPAVREKALSEVLVFLDNVGGDNPYLPAQSVSEIHLNQNGEMVVYLVEYPFPIFFGNNNTSTKYTRLVHVLKALYKQQNGKESISQVEYIQMDYLNDKVLVAQK
jgi:cell division protein FtsQ